ncbi:hypothetical protein [Alloalcanivorax xenomutans]|uniref:hypothetical protein n=1 Tax=Alloalcanivorax xenomutans TaxID=1094342 RepID=UPI003BAC516C
MMGGILADRHAANRILKRSELGWMRMIIAVVVGRVVMTAAVVIHGLVLLHENG